MEKQYEQVLELLYKASTTGSTSCTKVSQVPVKCRGLKLRTICRWLEANEYIANYSIDGWNKVSCIITFKTIDYFEKPHGKKG